MKLLTLGEASKLTGKSKPTISKAVRDGRLSGRKNEQGVFEIEASELFRVYPAKSSTPDSTPTAKIDTEQDAVAAIKVQHLELLAIAKSGEPAVSNRSLVQPQVDKVWRIFKLGKSFVGDLRDSNT